MEKEKKQEAVRPMQEYTFCEDNIVNAFKDMIFETHTHLKDARIAYLWRNKKWEKNGGLVPGTVKMVQPFMRPIAAYDFVIIVNHKYWQLADSKIRKAMIDHLLSCCGVTEDKNGNYIWRLERPAGAEFVGVVRRHGKWNIDLEETEDAWKAFFAKQKE